MYNHIDLEQTGIHSNQSVFFPLLWPVTRSAVVYYFGSGSLVMSDHIQHHGSRAFIVPMEIGQCCILSWPPRKGASPFILDRISWCHFSRTSISIHVCCKKMTCSTKTTKPFFESSEFGFYWEGKDQKDQNLGPKFRSDFFFIFHYVLISAYQLNIKKCIFIMVEGKQTRGKNIFAKKIGAKFVRLEELLKNFRNPGRSAERKSGGKITANQKHMKHIQKIANKP